MRGQYAEARRWTRSSQPGIKKKATKRRKQGEGSQRQMESPRPTKERGGGGLNIAKELIQKKKREKKRKKKKKKKKKVQEGGGGGLTRSGPRTPSSYSHTTVRYLLLPENAVEVRGGGGKILGGETESGPIFSKEKKDKQEGGTSF